MCYLINVLIRLRVNSFCMYVIGHVFVLIIYIYIGVGSNKNFSKLQTYKLFWAIGLKKFQGWLLFYNLYGHGYFRNFLLYFTKVYKHKF